jgi:putative peptide zinc metalloprotease protein
VSTQTLHSPVSPRSSGSPRLPFRLRPDLIAVEQTSAKGKRWVVKDPLSLEFFYFGEQEWFVLACLRQPTTIQEIQEQFRRRFPPQEIAATEIKLFLERVVRDNLVLIEERLGLGEGLLKQGEQASRNRNRFRWAQILYIRFKGIDPNAILNTLLPIGNLLFHPVFMSTVGLLMLGTMAFITTQFDDISSRMPRSNELFAAQNLFLMALVLGAVKIGHELAHGLACKRLGGECRELGVLLLAFVPCLYCNVSDTWMEPSKWKRMMVSAAGIYVELILATICFFMWYASRPGLFNSVCLNVVIICSINTVFINGNPLLRYDGYYLLADFFDVPNLATQAKSALYERLNKVFLQSTSTVSPLATKVAWMPFYAVASFCYRIFVICAILFGVHFAAKANDIEFVGDVAIGIALAGVFLPMVHRAGLSLLLGSQKMRIKPIPCLVLCLSLIVLGVLFFRVPIPFQKKSPAVLELRDPHTLFAPRPGRLTWFVAPGSIVSRGDTIAAIENIDLLKQRSLLEKEVEEKSSRLAALRVREKDESDPVPEIPVLETEICELGKQLKALVLEFNRLEVRSPVEGIVYAMPPRPPRLDPNSFLNQWHGCLMDPANRGCFVERGQALCRLARRDGKQVAVYLDQDWIGEVQPGSQVRICFDHAPQSIVEGQVLRIVGESVHILPDAILASGLIPLEQNPDGNLIPAEPIFRVLCEIPADIEGVLPGSTGMAKVKITNKTLAQRLLHFLNRTFHIDW